MTELLDAVRAMTPAEWAQASRLLHGWFPTGRPEQKPADGDWLVFAYIAGRGAGKTRSGAEWVAEQALNMPRSRGAVIAPTFADVRDTCIEGESGLGSVLRRRLPGLDWGKAWNRTLLEITLPNGSRIKGFSADEPERLRGPQHHYAWADEPGSWRYADAWDQLQFGLRLGERPRTFVTGTPRPVRVVRQLVERHQRGDATVALVRGSTFDNADNLSAIALAELRAKYEGTRLGRQELYGELLLDTPGALWSLSMIEPHRVAICPPLSRVVVAIDPAVTSGEDSDSTGVVAAGIGFDGHLYVLADRTLKASPERWARAAVDLFDELDADRIVAEVNNGGDLVETVLRTVDRNVPVRKVHASRGKRVRAEPIAALYEQGKVHHVGDLGDLEDQLTSWTPDAPNSPDRLDALVWALTDLAVEPANRRRRSIMSTSAA